MKEKQSARIEIDCYNCHKRFVTYRSNRLYRRSHCSARCYGDTLKKEGCPAFDRSAAARKTVETRRRNGTYKFSDEWRKKIGLGARGRVPWNKNRHTGLIPWNKGKNCPQLSGKNHPMFGKKHSPSTMAKITVANQRNARRGALNHRWKGGITPIHSALRNTPEYRAWRRAVFRRDGFACVKCHSSNHDLEADHIKPFSLFPELRLDVANGRTLCKPCHKRHGWREGKYYQ